MEGLRPCLENTDAPGKWSPLVAVGCQCPWQNPFPRSSLRELSSCAAFLSGAVQAALDVWHENHEVTAGRGYLVQAPGIVPLVRTPPSPPGTLSVLVSYASAGCFWLCISRPAVLPVAHSWSRKCLPVVDQDVWALVVTHGMLSRLCCVSGAVAYTSPHWSFWQSGRVPM